MTADERKVHGQDADHDIRLCAGRPRHPLVFEFSLYPFKETERKGWYEVPVIRVSAPTISEARALAEPQVPPGSRIWSAIEVTPEIERIRDTP